MITGDHIDTARAIANELGILDGGLRAITGAELDQMDDETFMRELEHIAVYARVQPEHKTRIVNAWRRAGYVTAMTGDGVRRRALDQERGHRAWAWASPART